MFQDVDTQITHCSRQAKNQAGGLNARNMGSVYSAQRVMNRQPCRQLIGLKPEHLDEYVKAHANVWPGVLAKIAESNIRNYSNFSILDPDQRTFGHILQEAGYHTAVAGKWQLYATESYGALAGTGTHPSRAGSAH